MRGQQITERQRRAVRALQAGGPAAPAGLVRRVEVALQRPPPPRRSWPAQALAVTAAAAAIAVVAVVVAITSGGPSVTAAAALVDRGPTEPAPAGSPEAPALLDRRFGGVTYPDWSRFGWMTMGARRDSVEGRDADTVFYTHHGHVIAYTVIAGEPLEPPAGATTEHAGGLELHRFRDGHRDVVTFVRDGRTCVLAGHVISSDTIVKLAAWRGDGAVRF
jgi:hypothetical protein